MFVFYTNSACMPWPEEFSDFSLKSFLLGFELICASLQAEKRDVVGLQEQVLLMNDDTSF